MRKLVSVRAIALLTVCASQSGDKARAEPTAPDKPTTAPPAAPPVAVSVAGLVDAESMTLCTYVRDVPDRGGNNCDGDCAFTWPLLQSAADAKSKGDFTIIPREAGGGQWA